VKELLVLIGDAIPGVVQPDTIAGLGAPKSFRQQHKVNAIDGACGCYAAREGRRILKRDYFLGSALPQSQESV
jgi:hypothetical protein